MRVSVRPLLRQVMSYVGRTLVFFTLTRLVSRAAGEVPGGWKIFFFEIS